MNGQIKVSDARKAAIDALQKFHSTIIGIAFAGGVLKFLEKFDVSNWTDERII
jgi:hypothetical protein